MDGLLLLLVHHLVVRPSQYTTDFSAILELGTELSIL